MTTTLTVIVSSRPSAWQFINPNIATKDGLPVRENTEDLPADESGPLEEEEVDSVTGYAFHAESPSVSSEFLEQNERQDSQPAQTVNTPSYEYNDHAFDTGDEEEPGQLSIPENPWRYPSGASSDEDHDSFEVTKSVEVYTKKPTRPSSYHDMIAEEQNIELPLDINHENVNPQSGRKSESNWAMIHFYFGRKGSAVKTKDNPGRLKENESAEQTESCRPPRATSSRNRRIFSAKDGKYSDYVCG
ncbi:hypothetical protein QAD02_003477 [Eretmocerus hayati]|uniref:Uncharacterized protein n=1 Tax=Eretmocerus hayati TaxID=131215 RepID=A0ACC2NLY2_9HYME|nr:hypothetical protein QAD02_003477 [Eretmocerus hayati]